MGIARAGLFLLVLLFSCSAVCGQTSVDGAPSMGVLSSARASAMGGCTVALLDDATAASWNPGGFAFVQGEAGISGMSSRLAHESRLRYKHMAAFQRVSEQGVFGTSFTHLVYDEQALTGPDGPAVLEFFGSRETSVSVAYGHALSASIGLGVNLKYVTVEQYNASSTSGPVIVDGLAMAADAGAELRKGSRAGRLWTLLRVGAAVRNFGTGVEYDYSDYVVHLPRAARLGGSTLLGYEGVGHLLLCAQYEVSLVRFEDEGDQESNPAGWGVGGELQFSLMGLTGDLTEHHSGRGIRDMLAVRAGYLKRDSGAVTGITYGVGAGLQLGSAGRVSLEAAKMPVAEGEQGAWRIGGRAWIAF